MTKRTFFLMLIFFLLSTVCFSSDNDIVKKEILLRIPLLAEKNAKIITEAIETLPGIMQIEACYELKVMIIGYDSELIKNETSIMNLLNQLRINTTIEKIYSSDIPQIKSNYKISNLKSIDNKTH